ncbi:MAG: ABC transporter ATP-binding protein [Jatrophihabitantaceae bacterium]
MTTTPVTDARSGAVKGADRDGTFAVRTHGLTRRFGKQVAVDEVDLVVPVGSIYGFLGPNGSGKTTTIRLLLGLLSADAGDIEVLGRPIPRSAAAVLPRVGALIEGPAFHPYVSGANNLRRLDRMDAAADPTTSRERIGAALARVGLTAAAGKRYRNYSLGMKQRLGLAAALLQPRDLLVLDEPTNGLDPQGTREVRKLVRELATDGTTVLVSSHLLSEIEQVATHVGMMAGGRLVRQGTLADVLADGAPRIRITTPDLDTARATLQRAGLAPVAIDHEKSTLTARLDGVATERVARDLVVAGVRLQGLAVDRPDLEDLFVSITGEGFDVLR